MDMLKKMAQGEVASKTTGPPIWQDGLCDCTKETGICCQTLCCWPCTMANIMNKRDTGVASCDCANFCAVVIGTYGSNNEFPSWLSFAFRRELIMRYGIQNETMCSSCLNATFCSPCSDCQVQREMAKRNEHCGGCCATPPASQPGLGDKAMGALGAAINGGLNLPRMWGSGLCGCGIAECCEGIFCPCIIFGYIGTTMDSFRVTGKPTGVQAVDPGACCGSLWLMRAWIFAHRREIIERYNIQGETHCQSCINTICCPFCSILQVRREMGWANEWPGGLCVKVPPPKA